MAKESCHHQWLDLGWHPLPITSWQQQDDYSPQQWTVVYVHLQWPCPYLHLRRELGGEDEYLKDRCFLLDTTELQSLRYSVPIFSKTLLKTKSLCYDNCPQKMGGKNFSNFPGGKNGHPTFECRESIHANPEYTKKTETKCQLLLFHCTIWRTLRINPILTRILFQDVFGNLEVDPNRSLLWFGVLIDTPSSFPSICTS